jgi:hypothetical protein
MKMRFKIYANLLLFLILVSFMSFVIPVQCKESYYDIHFRLIKAYWGTDQPVEVSSGDVATLSVVLRYEKGWSFKNLKAVLSLPQGFEAVGGDSESIAYYTGAISIGFLLKLEFPIFISPNVEIGSYKAKLRLEYYISKYIIPEEEIEVTFEVTGRPSINVNAVDGSLYEGKQHVLIVLSNGGDAAAHEIKIREVRSNTASIELKNATYLGTLEPRDNVTMLLSIFVPAGLRGQIIALTIEGSYLGPMNVPYQFSETLKLPVKPRHIMVESVERRGENIIVRLINMEKRDEEDVTVSLKYLGAIVGLPYRINIPLIKAGETRTVSFHIPKAYQQITLSIEYSDGFVDEKTFSISVFGGSLVELRCTYPERKVELGSTVYYPLTVINRGLSGVFKLSLTGLPSVFRWAFLKDNTDIQAIYLEEGETAVVTLAVDVPEIPLNYTLDENIPFKVTVTSQSDGTVEELEVSLTPTTTRSLKIYSKAWYGEAFSEIQGLHYTGIPYSTGLLSKGSAVAAKYRLKEGKTYIILLYGPFVGSRSDLNLYFLDMNGQLLAVSAESPGKPEALTVKIPETGRYLIVVSNEETTSKSSGEGVLLVSELQPASGSITFQLQPLLFQTSTILNITNIPGNTVTLDVRGDNFTILLYPFTSNRERTEYDPFVPRASLTVKSVNGTAELKYMVKRGDELILMQWKTSQPSKLTVKCSVHEETGTKITLLEQDLIYLTAALATATLIAIAIWGEKKILRSLS